MNTFQSQFALFLSLFYWNGITFGYKILIIHPVYASSHTLNSRAVAEALAERGHQIDIIKWKDELMFYFDRHINITHNTLSMDNSNGDWNILTKEEHAAFKVPQELVVTQGVNFKINFNVLLCVWEVVSLVRSQCKVLLENKELYNKLQNEKYDLAIIDLVFNECGLAFLHQLGIPIVGYWAIPFSSFQTEFTTAFLPASHTPAFFSQMGHEMNFFERALNVALKIGYNIAWSVQLYWINNIVQNYYPETPYPSDLLKNLSGMLINSDPALDYPRLLPSTFINVGGMHIRKPKPLPKEIEEWMESSGKHGVVVLSMGLAHDLNMIPKNVVNSFMNAFSKFPHKFVVKMEGTGHRAPSNVKLFEYIPQQDILAHPKTKAFITHCGANGISEAAYNGVPMIGMPISLDQGDNLFKITERGIAVGLTKESVTTEDIVYSLSEVLFNSKYKMNAEIISRLMRDVKETPKERTVDLIEYLIRHKGAEHLKLASRHLNWMQYFSLDTLAFLLVIYLLIVYLYFRIVKVVVRFIWNCVRKGACSLGIKKLFMQLEKKAN